MMSIDEKIQKLKQVLTCIKDRDIGEECDCINDDYYISENKSVAFKYKFVVYLLNYLEIFPFKLNYETECMFDEYYMHAKFDSLISDLFKNLIAWKLADIGQDVYDCVTSYLDTNSIKKFDFSTLHSVLNDKSNADYTIAVGIKKIISEEIGYYFGSTSDEVEKLFARTGDYYINGDYGEFFACNIYACHKYKEMVEKGYIDESFLMLEYPVYYYPYDMSPVWNKDMGIGGYMTGYSDNFMSHVLSHEYVSVKFLLSLLYVELVYRKHYLQDEVKYYKQGDFSYK
ncbi:MAG: hypothetical protein K6G88_11195 [Lachnospiraceae bacterium]|nr:hypothetical protein [Lachnospiraceae bacterium]